MLITSTDPSSFVTSIVILVAIAAITPAASIGGIAIATTPAAIPALTGISINSASSFLIFILATFPFSTICLIQAFSSSIETAVLLSNSPLEPSFFDVSWVFSIYIKASNTSPSLASKACFAFS